MKSGLFRFGAMSFTVLTSQASAMGFGDIVLSSRLGEPLSAEVGISAENSEQIPTACFRVVAARNSDLPSVTGARLNLVKSQGKYKLLISSTGPVTEPAFAIALQADCGIQLQREYVLLPSLPSNLPELPLSSTGNRSQAASEIKSVTPSVGKQWQAREGQTLAGIAEALYPNKLVMQRRMTAALQKANPQLDPALPLPADTPVRIPRLKQTDSGGLSSAQKGNATAQGSPGRSDGRLVIVPPLPQSADKKSSFQSKSEAEARLLSMEATMAQLHNEIDYLKESLAHTTKTLAAKQQELAERSEAPPPSLTANSSPPALSVPAPVPAGENWISLLLAGLGGAILTTAGAELWRRIRKSAEKDQVEPTQPTLHQAHMAVTEVQPLADVQDRQPAAAKQVAATMPMSKPIPDIGIGGPALANSFMPVSSDDEVEVIEESSENDVDSLLRIAEIMISFGRERGAADTLSQYIDKEEPSHFKPWLMLLDLYRRSNLREDFEMLAPRIRERFNIRIPTWEEAQRRGAPIQQLEDYPHLTRQIVDIWGTQDCMNLLEDLLRDNRHGTRIGFDLEVVEEIALLMLVLGDAYQVRRQYH